MYYTFVIIVAHQNLYVFRRTGGKDHTMTFQLKATNSIQPE